MFGFDRAGIWLSSLCVVHCVAMPVVVATLPTIGLAWLGDSRVHVALTVAAVAIAGSAFVPGFLKHGYLAVPILGAAGLGFLFWSTCFGETACACCRMTSTSVSALPTWLESIQNGWHMPLGGTLLVFAHVINGRCCHACRRRWETPFTGSGGETS